MSERKKFINMFVRLLTRLKHYYSYGASINNVSHQGEGVKMSDQVWHAGEKFLNNVTSQKKHLSLNFYITIKNKKLQCDTSGH